MPGYLSVVDEKEGMKVSEEDIVLILKIGRNNGIAHLSDEQINRLEGLGFLVGHVENGFGSYHNVVFKRSNNKLAES